MVIAVVALIVIGPEKLPKVARTAGAFFGRMQRFVSQVKDEVNRETRFHELQHLQDEVRSSLQQELDAVSHSIAPPAMLDMAPQVETNISKPRKPRAAKVEKKQAGRDFGVDVDASSKPVTARRSAAKKFSAANSPDLFEGHADDGQQPQVGAAPPKSRTRKKTSTTITPKES